MSRAKRERMSELSRAGISTQRQNELCAAYARADPGTTIKQVMKLCRVPLELMKSWMADTTFAKRIRDIQEERGRIDFSHFEPYMNAIDRTLVNKAVGGDVAAIGLVHELLGNRRNATNVKIDNRVGAQAGVALPRSEDEVRALLERRNTLAAAIARRLKPDEIAPIDSGDSGPGPDGNGSDPQP